MKRWFSAGVLIAGLLLASCGNPALQVLEAGSQTVTSTEVIRLNNCGGRDVVEQTVEQSFAAGVDLNAQTRTNYETVKEMVAGKYGLYKDSSHSQVLKAPPSTNMEFTLSWTDKLYNGNILEGGAVGKYSVHIPVSVELVSSRDLGCGTSDTDTNGHIRETLNVSFKDGATGVATENTYSGLVTIIVQGTGQAGGTAWSDAFYVFTDGEGNNIQPQHPTDFYNFTLWINGEPADTLVKPIPPFNADHVYQFTIRAPGGRLRFAVGDVYVVDNSGYFTVQILK